MLKSDLFTESFSRLSFRPKLYITKDLTILLCVQLSRNLYFAFCLNYSIINHGTLLLSISGTNIIFKTVNMSWSIPTLCAHKAGLFYYQLADKSGTHFTSTAGIAWSMREISASLISFKPEPSSYQSSSHISF